MNYLYMDASVLVAIALDDPGRGHAARAYAEGFDVVTTSALSGVETQAGLSHQLHAQPSELAIAEQNLNRLLERCQLVLVTEAVLRDARALVRRHRVTIGLRSADAVHVASACVFRDAFNHSEPSRITCVTADKRQFAAFTAEGIVGRLLA